MLVAFLTLYVMPASFQELRDLITKIRADFVANIVKEGQFTALDNGITFHFRERSGQALLGIFIQDKREPTKIVAYVAERGQVAEANGQSYLILESGTVHRQEANSRDLSMIAFERYAVDLAAFNQDETQTVYKPRERSTPQLLFPDEKELYYTIQAGRFRAELHDRLSAWLFPLALMFIAFAALGEARTTRQGRGTAVGACGRRRGGASHHRLCGLERGGPLARRGHRDLWRARSVDPDRAGAGAAGRAHALARRQVDALGRRGAHAAPSPAEAAPAELRRA